MWIYMYMYMQDNVSHYVDVYTWHTATYVYVAVYMCVADYSTIVW